MTSYNFVSNWRLLLRLAQIVDWDYDSAQPHSTSVELHRIVTELESILSETISIACK